MIMSLFLATSSLAFCLASGVLNTPFYSEGRWIRDSTNAIFTYAGVNWPGAADVMLPEGLQYQSIQNIVSGIKTMGFNVIRLTFATEMVDQVYANGGIDVPIMTAFINALGFENGTRITAKVVANNPSWTENTTRLQVFDAIAEECARHGIYIHLDNNMSKGEWCCSFTDGNGWFEDEYFDVSNWKRSLVFMAARAETWPSFISIGLRNELRPPLDNPLLLSTYNWKTWYENMVSAAEAVHAVNPDTLIFLGGINSDTYLRPIPVGADLGDGIAFDRSDFAYASKLVLELHKYDNHEPSLGTAKIQRQRPVYATCIRNYILKYQAGWMVWELGGSYYIRQGQQDSDEAYGILNHDWTNYRSFDVFRDGIGAMINASHM